MFKIKITHYPQGELDDIMFYSSETSNKYILKHVGDRYYKVFSPHGEIDINDGRGKWKEIDIKKNFERGTWVKLNF